MKLDTDVGRLDKRITIQKRSEPDGFDAVGNQLEEWSDFHSCWASVSGVSDDEYKGAREPRDKNIKSFKVRYCSKLAALTTDGYRITYKNAYYDIQHIDNLLEADSLLIIKARREETP
ncbi:MAG: phage head closure protein [Ruminococcus sp.]|nr:phage head closure protein [Ruminococcus sp.]